MTGAIARILPHPLLALSLVVVWLLLIGSVSLGGLLLGIVLAVGIAKLTAAFWPNRPNVRSPVRIVEYVLVVLYDIIKANVEVAYLVVFRRADSLSPRFVPIPLDLRTPEAITVFAGTITMTPGTLSADLSADGRVLLVHCLNTDDPEAEARAIKARYEARLREIFE